MCSAHELDQYLEELILEKKQKIAAHKIFWTLLAFYSSTGFNIYYQLHLKQSDTRNSLGSVLEILHSFHLSIFGLTSLIDINVLCNVILTFYWSFFHFIYCMLLPIFWHFGLLIFFASSMMYLHSFCTQFHVYILQVLGGLCFSSWGRVTISHMNGQLLVDGN